MSKHRVLGFKPQLRLEGRGQDGQNETEQPNHSASLGDSIRSSTRIRFSVHTMGLTYHAHVNAARIGRTPADGQQGSPLTQRERQCLAWISDGKTMQDIADLLGVSSRGVKYHLDNARRNLAALTLPHAVALAFRQGLLP
ncbi:helix-turn-helix domain-containing protein [Bradyrhizobium sp. LA6.12]|uniref:helix-turn-helix domain-containing protein n=1 Tax=unclassified Bradyrhizobium TaxID=2631580 RepID=UPI003394ECCA